MPNIYSILVIDDEPDNFDVIEILLFREDYHLAYAASGKEALQFLAKSQPDVILLDIMMPEMDGIEVCRQIKQNAEWRHIPIIVVTALHSKDDLARCLDAGADDFVSKPVDGTELRARVRSMLRIRQQYSVLRAAMQLRQDMAYMIVHDLRNLFTHISMACTVLQNTELNEKQQAKVTQVELAERRLESLADSLLMMAKLESGKLALNWESVNLRDLVAQVGETFQAIATQQRVTLTLSLPDEPKEFLLDAGIMRRVVENLLSNALKFSSSRSKIAVELDYPVADQARIAVKDWGRGVSEELRQKIFEKYEVGSTLQGIRQTGLGLAFCKIAIAAHQGSISVQDNEPKGAIFTVNLVQHPELMETLEAVSSKQPV